MDDQFEHEERPTRWTELGATYDGLHAYIEREVGHEIDWKSPEGLTLEDIWEDEYLDTLELTEAVFKSDEREFARAVGQ